MLSTDKEFFKPPEVAELLNVEPYRVIQFIHAGELRAVNVSMGVQRPRYRISRQDLEHFLAARVQPVKSKKGRPRKRQTRDDGVIKFF